MSGAGDVNGDGIEDLLIGAYGANQGAGASYVVFGRDTAETGTFPATLELSSFNGTNGFRLDGVAGDHSGAAVSGAGDVNGDGLADLLLGAVGARPNGASSGASYVVFGRDTAQTGAFPASLNLSILDGTNDPLVSEPTFIEHARGRIENEQGAGARRADRCPFRRRGRA